MNTINNGLMGLDMTTHLTTLPWPAVIIGLTRGLCFSHEQKPVQEKDYAKAVSELHQSSTSISHPEGPWLQ